MFFNELDARSIKEQVDQAQLWSAWIDADRMRRHSFMGTLDWEERNGRRYLYRRKGGTVKSFGLFGPETERARSAFQKGKEENAERLRVLSGEMDRQAAVLRAIGAGRIPSWRRESCGPSRRKEIAPLPGSSGQTPFTPLRRWPVFGLTLQVQRQGISIS